MRIERAEDVEGDREPLESEEERHQVARRDEERHARAGGGQQRVVLACVVAPVLAPRDEHRQRAGAGDDDRGERAQPVARERLGDQCPALGALVEDDRSEDARGDEAGERGEGCEAAAYPPRHEHAAEERDTGRAEQRQSRREREPVDLWSRDHSDASVTSTCGNERSEIAAGQAERKSNAATSGTTSASSSGRRSGDSSRTSGP